MKLRRAMTTTILNLSQSLDVTRLLIGQAGIPPDPAAEKASHWFVFREFVISFFVTFPAIFRRSQCQCLRPHGYQGRPCIYRTSHRRKTPLDWRLAYNLFLFSFLFLLFYFSISHIVMFCIFRRNHDY